MSLPDYIEKLSTRYKAGISTEHSYRGDLQNLLESIATDVLVTNEPARVACGAPDYILTKKNIPVGYIEAKDIGADLGSKTYKEQFDRYKLSLNNLIITDYLTFQLFRDGVLVTSVVIGQTEGNRITGKAENYAAFTDLIKDFSTHVGQTIKSAARLSKMMAGKARLLANVIEKALLPAETQDVVNEARNNSLREQFDSFKTVLIHDINEKTFADIYAQTIAYGMFAARLHDPSLEDFSRQEAAELIPKTNPFLRKLFQYIAGYDLDDRIKWIVDALADIFRATNVAELMKDFGKATQQHDPVIHFYETFLSEYDPKLRKSRGVWYTPQPVVNFIVRAVDDIVKSEFGLAKGLADISKTKIKIKELSKSTPDKRSKTKETEREIEVYKVQILDPATGTGTFLAEVVRNIYKQFDGQQGIWNKYIEEHLLARLNGFEILMASYAMAHLKLDLVLKETEYKATKDLRFKIYLTNSLEEHDPESGNIFTGFFSNEANEANYIKQNTPVMVVIGNPPYSVSSSNKSKWIENLTSDYKKDLNEKNIQPLSDDYIKFIRLGQYLIDKNGEGVLAYISNNSFIDGIIHRQMRKHLLETFDKIYILDLHGNSKRKETTPDGGKDENVFDIMQGVSINIFVKRLKQKKNKHVNQVYHYDLYGRREVKYNYLHTNSINTIKWNKLKPEEPNWFLVKKDFEGTLNYNSGIKIDELFIVYNNGIETGKDSFFYSLTEKELTDKLQLAFLNKPEAIIKYEITNTDSFKFLEKFTNSDYKVENIRQASYRPFDIVFCYYDKVLQRRPAYSTMINLFENNIGLLVPRQVSDIFKHVFISKYPTDSNLTSTAKKYGSAPLFPLYTITEDRRKPNLNLEIVNQIAEKLGLTFTNEKETNTNTYAPIDILDYIYAVLHCPTYREKYKEFLKIDFPRVPYPKDKEKFWQLVKLGGELRQIHLLESPVVEKRITSYPQSGNNLVEKLRFEKGKVWINATQYFEEVPQIAWEFYIGGYQPAQKWLKDRKGRELSFEDILHYQKIIVALTETERIMKEVDKVGAE